MPRLLSAFLLCLALAACTKQPHHDSAPDEVSASVRRALASCLAAMGKNIDDAKPTDRRRLDTRIQMLAGHALDDHLAMSGIEEGLLSEAQIRTQSLFVLRGLDTRRDGAEPHPVHLQLMAMAQLDEDQLKLLRLLTRELILNYRLPPPDDWDAWLDQARARQAAQADEASQPLPAP